MKRTIPYLPMGQLWIVGLIALGGGLLTGGPSNVWPWLLPAFIVGASAVWILAEQISTDRSGDNGGVFSSSTDGEDALETLKWRYSVGEIDETEFERRLETLLENETIADVENRLDVHPATASEVERRDERKGSRRPRPTRRGHRRHGMHRHGRH